MQNRIVNLGIIAEIAEALKELNKDVVFVGGSVISLYIDDSAAEEVRPTSDIDMAVDIASFGEWNKVNNRLSELGFHPDSQSSVICRYIYNQIRVDIMTTTDVALGPVNRWYAIGFENLQITRVLNQTIRVLTPACFIATKLEAFNSRGNENYRTSYDFEDIIYVLNNRTTIVEDILGDEKRILNFIQKEFQKLLDSPYLEEYISIHLVPYSVEIRYELVLNKLIQICKS